MSNFDDDLQFDDDDLFGDDADDLFADDDDGFGLDDDDLFADASSGRGSAGGGGGFSFDDEFGDVDDLGGDLAIGGGDDGEVDFEEDAAPAAGPSPGFVRWMAILGGVFVLQLIVIVALFFLRPSGPSDFELTSTAIAVANATTIAGGTRSAETQNAVNTQIALAASVSPTPSATSSNTPRPTFTPSPTLDATSAAIETGTAQAAQIGTSTQAAALTATASTPTPTPVGEGIEGTRQALEDAFRNITQTFEARQTGTPMDLEQGGGAETTPTREGATGGAGTGALPDTGLFDDLGASNSLGVIALAAFGLLGVIAFTRRLRSRGDDE